MEDGLASLIPRRSYNKIGFLCLAAFVSVGVILIGIASDFDSKATWQCNPDKTLAGDLSTRKYIETQCFLKYAQKFLPSLPLRNQLMINFGLVFLLSLIYAYWVKDRVEIFVDTPSATTNGVEDKIRPLSSISQAARDPKAYRKFNRFSVFMMYNMHLIFCRIIPLVVFAILHFTSSNYPVKYDCPWPIKTTISPLDKFLRRQSMNRFATVDCIYPIGSKMETLAAAVVITNFLTCSVSFIEVVFLLWSLWKDHNLLTDFEFCCVYILRKRKRIRKLIEKIKENICDDIFYLHDDFGEKHLSRRKLKEMYINVIIQGGRDNALVSRGKLKDRHEIFKTHLKLPKGGVIALTTTDDILKLCTPKHQSKATLLVGRPGIGKTFVTKKIFYEWQQQALESWHDKVVILLRFRNFNDTKGKTSLREMLRHSDGFNMSDADFNHIYEYICLFPKNLILIFDGLDELKIDDESLTESKTVNRHNEVLPVLQIFKQLVKGELLPGVTVLTTSRPTAEKFYADLPFSLTLEIMGFGEEQIEEYVQKFCYNEMQKSSEIWQLIKESPELLSLCYIPVNSYIVCVTLKESIEAEGERNIPKTITEVYKRAIKIILYRHHSKYKMKNEGRPKDYLIAKLPNDLQEDLKKLQEIAKNGMTEEKLIFDFSADDKLPKGLDDCGVFNKLEHKTNNIFCFLHLTIQEFLAAMHVVDDLKKVESFISEHIDDPWWHMVIQFISGLVGDKMRELEKERNILERSTVIQDARKRQDLRNSEKIINSICERFQDWMPKTARIRGNVTHDLLVIKCVHEMQAIRVMKLPASPFGCEEDAKGFCLNGVHIAPAESTALFQFLSHIENLHMLKFFRCIIEHFATRELAKLLLKNDNCKLTELDISYNNLTDKSVSCLSDALKSDKCKLTKLNIGGSNLTDKSIECISDALKSENCKLTELNISNNNLTVKSVGYLGGALMNENCKLTKLNLSINNLTNESGECLTRVLMSANCKLTELDISNNNLTDKSASCLALALTSNNCKITKLCIGCNSFTHNGCRYLTDLLIRVDSKLTELNIDM